MRDAKHVARMIDGSRLHTLVTKPQRKKPKLEDLSGGKGKA